MDEIIQKALKQVESKTRSTVPWKFDEPWNQSYYTWQANKWQASDAKTSPTEASSISKLALYTWNIDFMLPFPSSRMQKGLGHLQSLISIGRSQGEDTASIIYLQECIDTDIEVIAASPWIRETFYLSDLNISNWQSGHYGTITLVDKRLPITSCFRVHYSQTRMERDGLFVDVVLRDKIIRCCNSHLESMAFEPPYRIPQMKLCAEYMCKPGIDSAIAAGDFNAIQEFDRTLHEVNGLKDAFLQLGGREDDAANGHTWGQQAASKLRDQFGTSRMDKVYFCGGLELVSFERFGAGICVDDEQEREAIVKLGFEEPWITDHLGVKAVFNVSGAKSTL